MMLILGSLSGIVWIALALRELDVVTSQGQSAMTLLAMTTLALPNLTALIAPFAFLIAALHTLNRLSGDSELIVMTAGGGTVWVIARPLLALALIVMAAVSFANHVGMPWSLQQLRSYVVQVRTDLLSQVLQAGRFSSPERGLTFHIRERAPNGEILGLLMHDTRKDKQSLSYLAERGVIVKQENSAYIVMTDGHVVTQDDPKDPPRVVTFDKYVFDLDEMEQGPAGETDLKPRERFYPELVAPDPDSPSFKRNPGHFTAELHERFSSPLYPLAFAMIVLVMMGRAESTRQNRATALGLTLFIAAGIRLGGLAVNNLVALNPALAPVLYVIPLATIIICLAALARGRMQRRGPSVADRVSEIGNKFAAGWRRVVPARIRLNSGGA